MSDISDKNWNAMSDDYIAGEVGEFIKYHRMEQHKTQAMLAKAAGVSRSTIGLLERGGVVTVTTLIQVLRVLDQLQVFDGFTIIRQQSPLLLAKAEKKKKQRVGSQKKKEVDADENMNW